MRRSQVVIVTGAANNLYRAGHTGVIHLVWNVKGQASSRPPQYGHIQASSDGFFRSL